MQGAKCFFFFGDTNSNRKRLFEEAVTSAKNGKVLFILREELTELPELSQDLSLVNRHFMKLISFLYAKSLECLIESVSTLPEWQNIPTTIILEDLNGYCNNNMHNACAVIAFLIDSARSCSVFLNAPTKLCISVSKGTLSDSYCDMLQELYCTNT